MTDHVYKTLTITGSSKNSIEEAVSTGISRAGESVHSLRWFEIDKIRGHIEDGAVDHYQVTMQIGFTLDE
jgi:flavin-binding protein dodecin